eukprot:965542-Amphidinium_carterae.1
MSSSSGLEDQSVGLRTCSDLGLVSNEPVRDCLVHRAFAGWWGGDVSRGSSSGPVAPGLLWRQ